MTEQSNDVSMPCRDSAAGTAGAAARAIAFYLPQFHSIPENDTWWGAGFTEWTNVRRARPLFDGHIQPRAPGELGYYDLGATETREAQAELARAHGIEAFCYWHYWFAGRRLLERPFTEVVKSGKPDFPFCVAWANHDWSASWVGRPYDLLMAQTYPGRADYERHFDALRDAFLDDRYLKIDGKPLFIIFRPKLIPEPLAFVDLFRERAHAAGLPGLFVVGIQDPELPLEPMGLDGSVAPGIGQLVSYLPPDVRWKAEQSRRLQRVLARRSLSQVHQAIARAPRPRIPARALRVHDWATEKLLLPLIVSHEAAVEEALRERELAPGRFPCVVPNWDNTPRMGRWGTVLRGSSPELFGRHLRHAVQLVANRPAPERLVFLKSWNEWAEGNYLEPDSVHARRYLEAARHELLASGTVALRAPA